VFDQDTESSIMKKKTPSKLANQHRVDDLIEIIQHLSERDKLQ